MTLLRLALVLTALVGLAAAPAASAETLAELPHRVQPAERLIIGGQPDEAMLREAAAAGVQVVVNLRGAEEPVDFDEARLVTELGMRYVHLPIASAKDLNPENTRAFGELLQSIGDQPTLMHCASGNRVGALHALHAGTTLGADVDTAIEFGRAHGMTSLEGQVREQLEPAAEPTPATE
jgi:uncharacterized protein (TIGR01244 family)